MLHRRGCRRHKRFFYHLTTYFKLWDFGAILVHMRLPARSAVAMDSRARLAGMKKLTYLSSRSLAPDEQPLARSKGASSNVGGFVDELRDAMIPSSESVE